MHYPRSTTVAPTCQTATEALFFKVFSAGLRLDSLLTYACCLIASSMLTLRKVRGQGVAAVEIFAEIAYEGTTIAEIVYRTGFHVEVRVSEEHQADRLSFALSHSTNKTFQGTWEEALDSYFNEGCFDSREAVFPGELRRVGSAREHKSLFRMAVRTLQKDLQSYGYEVTIRYT